MTDAVLRADLPPDPVAVRVALVRLVADLLQRGLQADDAATLELVLAEVLNNIVEHAFAGGDEGAISVALVPRADHVDCEVRDTGGPMPGNALPEGCCPDATGGPPTLSEGGYGWFLIRSLSDGLTYARTDKGNQLRFRVRTRAGLDNRPGANPALSSKRNPLPQECPEWSQLPTRISPIGKG